MLNGKYYNDKLLTYTEVKLIGEDYVLILDTEDPDHEIYEDVNGTIRWLPNEELQWKIMNEYNATNLNELFKTGASKNDPTIRKLYKHMGFSLTAFYDVFYWEVNNPEAQDYIDTQKLKHAKARFPNSKRTNDPHVYVEFANGITKLKAIFCECTNTQLGWVNMADPVHSPVYISLEVVNEDGQQLHDLLGLEMDYV